MDNINLVESFSELKEVKNIDKETMIRVMQDVFRTVITKKYGSSDNFDIIVNPNKGDLEIWRNRTIVDDDFEDFDENIHIKLKDARKVESDFEIDEEFTDELKIIDFGRRSISSIKQILKSKIIDLSKSDLLERYSDRVGEIITGDVYQILRNEVIILDDDGTELILPKSSQVPGDFFKKGQSVRAVISSVELRNNNIVIFLSRTSNTFLEKILEIEIPEIFDGVITVKAIAREAGYKSKVAVESYDDRIDPVGTCIGARGSKIQSVVREMNSENIDVISYTDNSSLFIMRALNATKATVTVNEELKTASIFIEPSQMALCIGKGGINIKLASKLTGYKLNVFSNDVEIKDDVLIDEFRDEIDEWIIDVLKGIGLDTAQSVLKMDVNLLIKQSDLEEETIREVIKILESEFI